ncbi:hypothetical protein O3G_MSEX010085 [Manduca sexta]|uniref:Uncharacterized protein n=1 Tax=Manduca sexta TaxID=7130 RepID=A0A922CT92_MANSE|nr:hypothetical protein O3G_MSEX010085 [Manduca sexta]
MNILLRNLALMIPSILVVSSIDYGHVHPDEARPMPPELAIMFVNKSDVHLEMEECMRDYVQCMGTNAFRDIQICASNKFGQMQTFQTMCDMFYENCKGSPTWGYYQDNEC